MRKTSITGLLVFFMFARTLVNTAYRMVYPFLPVLARAFGVSQAVFSASMSVRPFAGLVNVFLSGYTDSRGRKFGILLGNSLFLGGVALLVLWPTFPAFVVAMGLTSLGNYVMGSAIQAFVGDEVPVRERGRAFGLVELSWALSYLVGIWGVRLLLERAGWLAPFPVLGFLGLLVWIGIVRWVPPDRRPVEHQDSMRSGVGAILRNRGAVLVLLVSVAIAMGNELVTLVFAVWLEDRFGLSLAALAGAATLIGIAELSGESLVGILTDRLGAIRAVGYGLVLNCLFAVLLPVFGQGPAGAFVGLFLFYLTFEFTIVSGIILVTQVPTKSRATMMALNIACLSIGRIVSAWVALPVYALGFAVVLGVAVMINLAGLAALRGLVVRLRNEIS